MVNCRICSRRSTRRSSSGDNGSSSFLYSGKKHRFNPAIVIDDTQSRFSCNSCLSQIWIHGIAVVAPNGELFNVQRGTACLDCDLCECTIMVETSHSSEVTGIKVGGVVGSNKGIGVCRVADHYNFGAAFGTFVKGLALFHEYLGICFHQVGTFHTGSTWSGADEQSVVDILEPLNWITGLYDSFQKRECTVLQLHRNALERLHSLRDLKQMENDWLIWPEQSAASDSKKERISNISGSASDSNSCWGLCETCGECSR
mmetsp:Transcript_9753/g.15982  ORF Transcript_9753/g.15982 Transcript_9753/m.15982 type:complete len:258 (+) Transcript_9753:445-1218(+)